MIITKESIDVNLRWWGFILVITLMIALWKYILVVLLLNIIAAAVVYAEEGSGTIDNFFGVLI